MFFKQETRNSNKEKYFVKTIGSKPVYGSTTTVIANLICLANITPALNFHFELPSFVSFLVLLKENYPSNVL